ncbi:oligosaccharide flippase family protein [Turicibacter sanguinis]|uniref:oligosaccharide flippase family protein n=1 Tax=Turicibacter sanguinis TaxID=154288 RepID=UPI0018ABFAAD|nr:oligosaccharide flippase family protein [Turicibacter sanguinis]MDB8553978.1 oligosaccharide flippase family protein [Turicibacter sanguinis]
MAKRREIKAGIGYTLGNIMVKGITFVSLPLFARLLTTEQFGVFNTYIAYEEIIAIFIGLGMYGTIKNARYDFEDDLDKYISTLLLVSTSTMGIIFMFLILFQGFILNHTGLSITILIFMILQSYGTSLLQIFNARLALDYNYKKFLFISILNTIGNIGISLLLVLTVFSQNREVGRIIGSALPLIFIGIYIFITEGKKSKFYFDKTMARYSLLIGFPLVWHFLSQTIAAQADRIMLTYLKGPSETGIYSFIYSVAVILRVIYYSADNVWSVWFFSQMDKKDYHAIRNNSKKYILLITFIAALMIVGSREIIMVMGSKDYWIGIDLFIPIIIGIFLLFLYTIPAAVEYYYKKTKYIAKMTLLSAVLNIILNYFLIQKYSYMGAAITTMFSYFILFCGHWIISQKILKQNKIEKLFNINDFIIALLILIMVGVVVSLLNPYPLIKYLLLILILAILFIFNKELIKLSIHNIKNK